MTCVSVKECQTTYSVKDAKHFPGFDANDSLGWINQGGHLVAQIWYCIHFDISIGSQATAPVVL